MKFDWCKANLHTSCEEHKYDHCEMCNMARAYQHGYETAQEDMSIDAVEVVRCRNCYYAEDDITHMFCVYFGHKVYGDDYCSNAVERREDGEA